ncbi:MAG: BamA/TamA family outer membrane protein [Chitinophagaceae bacterium]
MKFLLNLVFIVIFMLSGFGQDSIRYRIIWIGDAGKKKGEKQLISEHAASNILRNKTAVIYLDKNEYLPGNVNPGGKDANDRQSKRRLQYVQMRKEGAGVFFISGNYDWSKTGINDPGKININRPYREAETDSLLGMVSGNACPDPLEINLSDKLVMIVFNSEWWLHPAENENIDAECDCKTKLDVLDRLDELRYKNQEKFILLASHHPIQSPGNRSKGRLKDHIFPLTAFNEALYIPLPVAGTLYRFFRSAFAKPDNVKHPLYKDMVGRVHNVFDSLPNLIYIAGEEYGLQFLKDKQVQLLIGPGASHIRARKGKQTLFADTNPGYVIMDLLQNNSIRVDLYSNEDQMEKAFSYTVPFLTVNEKDTISRTEVFGDSIIMKIHPSYNKPGKLHRIFFGENYRKEWATPTSLPVIRLSRMHGGLIPLKRGGGMQSKSLRLVDNDGKEWILRSVEKSPDALLPEGFRQTFARDWLDDATSAQHPFSALVVPPIANAINLPHANPVIGFVAPDKNLGIHQRTFAGMVVLMEEREPLGESDNTPKMEKNLQQDNDNIILAKEFLDARMLDMLLGDWDRHEDQWRWKDKAKGKNKTYIGIPRDRDQVFHVTQGLIPKFASRDYILPTLRNFDYDIEDAKWVLFKTRFVNSYPEFQISREDWYKQAEHFMQAITDSVLEAALKRLPLTSYQLRHEELFKKLSSRRNKIPSAMDKYYRFTQKIVDIQTSDKNEWVQITGMPGGGMNISISKLNKEREARDLLMNKTYDPDLTKEIRIYIRNGNDSVVMNNKESGIRVRIIGGKDKKSYRILESEGRVDIYDKLNESEYYGDTSAIRKHISNDSLNTAFVPVNLYNIWMPLTVIGLNVDDGFIIGTGFKYIKQEGFRKFPYVSSQQLLAGYSFSSGAYRIRYTGEWIQSIGNTDFVLHAVANAPNNTVNFFGRGNETDFIKADDDKTYNRTRFSTYQLNPSFRRRVNKNTAFSAGPSLYYYSFSKDDNEGRFINNISQIGSYDSSTIEKDKWHLGATFSYARDTRNNKIVPQWGSRFNIQLRVYNGLGQYSKSFAQFIPEISFFKSLSNQSTIVLAERLGGTVGLGHTAFYQSAFIGGHENLYGYRQYRFAGQHSIYNNLELRIKLADVASYIIPGQFGITGFWDIGRVWERNDKSDKWHHGTGAGIYFAPASIVAFNFVMGYSNEGWYPYFTLGLRF